MHVAPRRLRHLCLALTRQSVSATRQLGGGGGTANGLGVRVQQDPATGAVTPQALEHVLEQKLAAVAAEDYALAGHLHQLASVLDPSQRQSTEQCAPSTAEAQIECFHRNGFVILRGVMAGERLARAQQVWTSLMEPQWAEWEARRAENMAAGRWQAVRFFDLQGLMEADEDLWLDLMDAPAFRPCATRFAGGGGFEGEVGPGQEHYHGVARVGGVGGRVVPPDTDTRYSVAPLGYGGWHRGKCSSSLCALLSIEGRSKLDVAAQTSLRRLATPCLAIGRSRRGCIYGRSRGSAQR